MTQPVDPVPVLRLSVLVSVRNEMMRCGLSTMLKDLPAVASVRGSGDVADTVRQVTGQQFDVLVLSPVMGLETVEQLAAVAAQHGVRTLLLLQGVDEQLLIRAASLPVDGFLLESDLTRGSLEESLLRLIRGELPMPSSLTRRLVAELRRYESSQGERTFLLTPRERQALGLLAEGLSNKQIARRLNISEHGAKRHVANVLAKLNCPNRTLAVAVALRYGLVPQPA
jgi:DNA-binding NarL/FixJ family response regulator